MDFTDLAQKCQFLSLFRYFPIQVAIRDRKTDSYVFHSSERNWGGFTYEEWNELDKHERENYWVQPDRQQQLKRYESWLNSGSNLPLRLTFKVNTISGEQRRIQCHFEHIPDEETPNRYILEISWDVTEVIDNCLKDRSLVADVNKKVLHERNKLRAESGLMRLAFEKLQDPQRLEDFTKAAQGLDKEELLVCFRSYFPDFWQVEDSPAGWAVAREMEEMKRLEDSLVEIEETALPTVRDDIERIIDMLRSQLLMLRVQRNEGADMESFLSPQN